MTEDLKDRRFRIGAVGPLAVRLDLLDGNDEVIEEVVVHVGGWVGATIPRGVIDALAAAGYVSVKKGG